jgi:cytochrome c oxidase subunit 4
MADHASPPREAKDAALRAGASPVAAQHAADAHADHPTAAMYVKVGVFLTLITVAEVWAYYIPSLVAMKGLFITLLLVMSAVKFFTVVALYMHLKYDHRLFRAFFVGPFIVAAGTMLGLMFLFGKLAIRLGILQ